MENILKEVKPIHSRVLPEKYDLSHAVAFFYHDELASLVADLESSDSLQSYLELGENEIDIVFDLHGEELWQWLKENGREDVIYDLTYRQLTAGVLTDASHFIFESLITSAKGKLTVSFSLLRKPFKESLLLLEWLCSDPQDLIKKFNGETIDPYILNRLSKEKRLSIMKDALSMIDSGFDEEILWAIRYDKNYGSNLETLWTKATHLVTSVKASATEPGNLNFIFSDSSVFEDQWRIYYEIVPMLLYYYLEIAELVVSRFVEWNENLRSLKLLRRRLAFYRYFENSPSEEDFREIEGIYNDFENLNFPCLNCESNFLIPKTELDRFWLRFQYLCPNCGNLNSMWDAISNDTDLGLVK